MNLFLKKFNSNLYFPFENLEFIRTESYTTIVFHSFIELWLFIMWWSSCFFLPLNLYKTSLLFAVFKMKSYFFFVFSTFFGRCWISTQHSLFILLFFLLLSESLWIILKWFRVVFHFRGEWNHIRFGLIIWPRAIAPVLFLHTISCIRTVLFC